MSVELKAGLLVRVGRWTPNLNATPVRGPFVPDGAVVKLLRVEGDGWVCECVGGPVRIAPSVLAELVRDAAVRPRGMKATEWANSIEREAKSFGPLLGLAPEGWHEVEAAEDMAAILHEFLPAGVLLALGRLIARTADNSRPDT